jgi:uncharacterized protein (DUF849 family)
MATSRPVLLKACLNGSREPGEHPLLPGGSPASGNAELVAAAARLAREAARPLLEAGERGRVPGDPAVPVTGLWSQVDDQLEVEP